MRLRLPPLRVLAPYLLIAAGLSGLGWWWWQSRPRPSDEQRLAALVAGVAHGVEQHRLGEIVGPLSREYQDSRGYNYQGIWRQAVRYVGARYATRVQISNFQPEVAREVAVATLQVRVTSVAGVSYQGALTLHFRREGLWGWRGWKITNSEGWQGVVEAYR